jgi:hypothetical protein
VQLSAVSSLLSVLKTFAILLSKTRRGKDKPAVRERILSPIFFFTALSETLSAAAAPFE